jgi:AraC family transcriptional regulator
MPPVWDPDFRPGFYARWGRESAVICARARRVAYPEFRQLLSIKAARGGVEDYFLDGRRMAVDDDTFAIINAGRSYASRISALVPVHSFSVFFETHLLEQVAHSMRRSADELLEDPQGEYGRPIEFDERLHEHDQRVTPVLRRIWAAVNAGADDEGWLAEQLHVLLAKMIGLHDSRAQVELAIDAGKASTRRELLSRLGRGVDYIHAHYRDPIRLRDIAAAAHVSPFHFLRTFKAVHRITPNMYLNRKRAAAAVRLLRESDWNMTVIAEHVGFGSRTSLFRHLRSEYGIEPRELRAHRRPSAAN